MEHPDRKSYDYAIDDRDVLVSVSDAWLQFAAENAAGSLTRDAVLGHPLWEFVDGDATRDLYRLLFARIREDAKARTVPFRCDSPDRYRFMELRMAPEEADGIALHAVLLREQPRTYCPILDLALPRTHYSYPACSFCRRIFAFGDWLEAEEAIRRLGAFDESRAPGLEPGVCDACRRRAVREAAPAAP